ncbi:fimbria/pilus outer membrane usher protein [Vibrio navarrensis]|uniref:fimbria/pilus outer membrane usher protein n=1 Tax=Vibrio navarrensis TaxID=29495 RepID=UPI0018660F15|nr:fimbria/pilus outer membrane usher protein [Vibrio navarrensis]MBE4605682.1 hypothetical protein [Vibrio navarrensis]
MKYQDDFKFAFILIALCSLCSYSAIGAEEDFDSRFIFTKDGDNKDSQEKISEYFQSNAILPGKYSVNFYVNNTYIDNVMVEIKEQQGVTTLCKNSDIFFSDKLALNDKAKVKRHEFDCGEIERLLNARWEMNTQNLSVNYIIPDKYLKDKERSLEERVHANLIDGMLLNYELNYNDYNKDRSNTLSANVQAQANVNDFSFYADAYYADSESDRFNISQAYVAVPLYDLQSELRAGDLYTQGGTLTSGFPIRGVSMNTDSDMWSESRKRFLIPITGVVSENSTIKFYYNDILLTTRYVEAGPYRFDDITPPGSGEIKVVEEGQSGKKSSKLVTIPAQAALLPSGEVDYHFSLGKYKRSNGTIEDAVAFLDLGYGMGYMTPTFTSVIGENYYSNEIGLATVTPNGSDVELSLAQSSFQESRNNLAYAIKYSNRFNNWLNLNINHYQYLDDEFMSFTDYKSYQENKNDTYTGYDSKTYLSLNLQSKYKYLDSISLSYNYNKYHPGLNSIRSERSAESYSMVLFGRLGIQDITYNLSASATRNDHRGSYQPAITLNFSIPLQAKSDLFSLTSLSAYLSRDSDGNYLSGASGSGMINQSVNYTVSNETDWHSGESDSFLALQGNTNYNQFYAALSKDNLYMSVGGSMGYSNPSGIVASANRGENPTLVKLGNLSGVEQFGTETNQNGYLMLNSSAYREKELKLDVAQLPGDVSVASSRETFTQGKGTFALVQFNAEKTASYFMKIRLSGRLLELGDYVKTPSGRIAYVSVDHGVLISESVQSVERKILALTINDKRICNIKLDEVSFKQVSKTSKVHNLGVVNCE